MIEPRRAVLADAPACAAVLGAWIDATDWMDRHFSDAAFAEMIAKAMPEREIWVIGQPVEAYASFDPVSAKIGALYCARTGQGLGKALLDKLREGRDSLWLTTEIHNHAAHRFYHREGFLEVGRMDPEPPETVPLIKMEWRA